MATHSEPASPDARDGDERLHPLSWLFVLLQQLRSFAVPLILLVATGRRSSADLYGLVGVGGLVVTSLIQYLTYRYRLGRDGILIRSGVFQRTTRDIPYERIHTVALHQSLLHRLFGVAELRLESAGSKQAEATMRVLSLADARALERLIRERTLAPASDRRTDQSLEAADETTLLSLGTAEIVRLGLISNRGLVVVAALFGFSWQFMGEGRALSGGLQADTFDVLRGLGRTLADHLHDAVAVVLFGLLLLLAMLVIVRMLSVVLAVLQFHGFSLVETGTQLRVERGLLTRVRNQVPRRRIQTWRISETLFHRAFGRQSLRVDSAVAHTGNEDQGLRHLAPVATPEVMAALLDRLLPGMQWPPADWQPLHPKAWRRMFVIPTTVVMAATAALVWMYGVTGLLLPVVVPLIVLRARQHARHAGYRDMGSAIVVRDGWLSRHWGIVEVRKLQSLRLTQSPFDRRYGMATIWFDTAGAGAAEGVLRIHYLPVAVARDLYGRLAAGLDATASPEAITPTSSAPITPASSAPIAPASSEPIAP